MTDVRQLRYRTSINGATYRVLLTRAAVRVDVAVHAPYVLSITRRWERVWCAGLEYTDLLAKTERALRPLIDENLEWRMSMIASERGGFTSAYASLQLNRLADSEVRRCREALPRGTKTHVFMQYERPRGSEHDKLEKCLPPSVPMRTSDTSDTIHEP